MNPHISLPRPTGGPSNFGSTPSSRRNEIKMPRFFKRMFKFPQMDFEMAVWEIMSLIIAPKKVFRQIFYHVCYHVVCCILFTIDHSVETNHKDVPPARPFLHVPTFLLPHPHIPRLGLRIRRWLHTNSPHHACFHLWAFSAAITHHSHNVLLSRRPLTRT